MSTNKDLEEPPDVESVFAEGTAIDAALDRAVRAALIVHKKLGQSVVIWHDGKVVWVRPDQIEDDGGIRLP